MFAYTFALLERVKAELELVKADRKGVTALEYGVIAAAIVGCVVAAMALLTPQLTATFGKITTALTPAA